MIKCLNILILGLGLVATASFAGTIIKIQNSNEIITVLTDGQKARMDMAGSEYVIVDYTTHQMKMVNPAKQEVMVVDADGLPKTGSAPGINTELRRIGSGGKVAGYDTNKFEYFADGDSCGVVYGSKQAFEAEGIKDLLNAMKIMIERQRAMLGGLAGMMNACILADMKMSDHVDTLGVPMRTEKRGKLDMEIKSIELNANVKASTFVIPAAYRTVSMNEQLNGMGKQGHALQQQQQPQMQHMMQQMQQMQQSGQLTPEMMEQMRRAQEMMKQYQR